MAKKNQRGNREPRKPKKQKDTSDVENSVSAALRKQLPGQRKHPDTIFQVVRTGAILPPPRQESPCPIPSTRPREFAVKGQENVAGQPASRIPSG